MVHIHAAVVKVYLLELNDFSSAATVINKTDKPCKKKKKVSSSSL